MGGNLHAGKEGWDERRVEQPKTSFGRIYN